MRADFLTMFGFRFGFGLFGVCFASRRGVTRGIFFLICFFRTVQFVLKFFIQAKGLLPNVQLVTRFLRFFFVCAKIKMHIDVSHRPKVCDAWRGKSRQGPGKAKDALSTFFGDFPKGLNGKKASATLSK